jgi:hypothetical protein
MVAVLLLLLAAAASAQSPVMINDLECPANEVSLPTSTPENMVDLFNYQQPNTTYILQPGDHDLSAYTRVSKSSTLCYVANETAVREVVVNLSGLLFVDGGTLGLKGLVVDGSESTTLPTIEALSASLSVEDTTFQSIIAGAEYAAMNFQATNIKFSRTTFRGLNGLNGLYGYSGSLQLHEVRHCTTTVAWSCQMHTMHVMSHPATKLHASRVSAELPDMFHNH